MADPLDPERDKARDPVPGAVGRYVIEEKMAQGGMGVVYRGRDQALGRPVVLKTWRADKEVPKVAARLEREAKTLGKLNGEGICPIHDVVEEGGRLFVVLPFIVGRTLAAHVAGGERTEEGGQSGFHVDLPGSGAVIDRARLTPAGAEPRPARRSPGPLDHLVLLMARVARSVHKAHEVGIVHRDLKPGNIMVQPDGEPMVLDFGLALDESAADVSRLTSDGEVLGTPRYMAPEQIDPEAGAIDRRTDVYALGAILYEVLTGRAPYTGRSIRVLFNKILRGSPLPPRRLNRAIPRDLEAVCLKALEPAPGKRYETALGFAEDLERVLAGAPTHARPINLLGRIGRTMRRNRVASAAIAAALIAAAFLVVVLTAQQRLKGVTGAYFRAKGAIDAGRPPDPADVQRLGEVVRDPRTRARLLRSATDPDTWKKISASVQREVDRGPTHPGEERLLYPWATIADPAPAFRFEVPEVGAATWRLVFELFNADQSVHTETLSHTGPARTREVRLPAGVTVSHGVVHGWSVRRENEPDPYHPLYAPGPARFEIVDPSAREALLGSLLEIGDPAFDALQRAAVLLRGGFAFDAILALDGLPEPTAPEVRNTATLLRAEAALATGDAPTFERLRSAAAPRRTPR